MNYASGRPELWHYNIQVISIFDPYTYGCTYVFLHFFLSCAVNLEGSDVDIKSSEIDAFFG